MALVKITKVFSRSECFPGAGKVEGDLVTSIVSQASNGAPQTISEVVSLTVNCKYMFLQF